MYHRGNKTQSKVILLALNAILHGSLFSQKANSRTSLGLRIIMITHLCFPCVSHDMRFDEVDFNSADCVCQ